MITGASNASVAMLVIDCCPGGFERGWQGYQATCQEHATLARTLGASQLVVAMNKMEMVKFSEQRWTEIVEILRPFLKKIGYNKEEDIHFVPISGLNGENLITRSQNPDLTSWYKGECLVEILDRLRVPKRALEKPLRLTVLDY